MTSVMIDGQREQAHHETFTMWRSVRTAILVAMSLAVAWSALPKQTLRGGTYRVVVDPNATNTGNITVAVTNPVGDQL
jgi:hypothetical protein